MFDDAVHVELYLQSRKAKAVRLSAKRWESLARTQQIHFLWEIQILLRDVCGANLAESGKYCKTKLAERRNPDGVKAQVVAIVLLCYRLHR